MLYLNELFGGDPSAKTIRKELGGIGDSEVEQFLLRKIELGRLARARGRTRRFVRDYVLKRGGTNVRALNFSQFVRGVNSHADKPTVLFVARHPGFDLLNASIYLRRTGRYRTALATSHVSLVATLSRHFDAVWTYSTDFDLCAMLMRARPWLIHAQGCSSMYPTAFYSRLFSDAPVVASSIELPWVVKQSEQDYEGRGGHAEYVLDRFLEPHAFTQLDGVTIFNCALRTGEERKRKLNSSAPLVEWQNYVVPDFIADNTAKLSARDGRTHIVYAGIVAPSNSETFYGDVMFGHLIKVLTDQQLHFHVYPSPHSGGASYTRKILREYIDIAERNPYFHYHDPVPPDRLPQELAQYDYASVLPTFSNLRKPEYWKSIYTIPGSIPSKFFKYLEAGLPVLINPVVTEAADHVRKTGAGLVIEESEYPHLSEFLARTDYSSLTKGVRAAQEAFSMERHFPRLLAFYDEARRYHTSRGMHRVTMAAAS